MEEEEENGEEENGEEENKGRASSMKENAGIADESTKPKVAGGAGCGGCGNPSICGKASFSRVSG
ncbi:hypothetical protein [Silvibacterium bohemicum]|uniref:hypothetical protein n=1 Tax=Silvibacterium bohemicum TaxID=1577686 RepID=UPI000A801E8E|nr:hypothetical protein [Silvibacterium bohemicum]